MGTKPVLLDEAVTARVWLSFVAPEEIPLRETMKVVFPLETFVLISLIGSSVGGSLTELKVTLNELLAVAEPSLAIKVMRVTPNWLVVGTSVTVRLVPLPSMNMLV